MIFALQQFLRHLFFCTSTAVYFLRDTIYNKPGPNDWVYPTSWKNLAKDTNVKFNRLSSWKHRKVPPFCSLYCEPFRNVKASS